MVNVVLCERDEQGRPKIVGDETPKTDAGPTTATLDPLAPLRRALWMQGWPLAAIEERMREVAVIRAAQEEAITREQAEARGQLRRTTP